MKKVLKLAVYVLALSSIAATVSANSYNVRSENGTSCSQNDNSEGSSVSTEVQHNTATLASRVIVRYTYKFGNKDVEKVDCNRLFNINVANQQLQLEKAQMEVELLKLQIAAAKSPPTTEELNFDGGDDW